VKKKLFFINTNKSQITKIRRWKIVITTGYTTRKMLFRNQFWATKWNDY